MLSIERCQEILRKNDCHLANETIAKLREYLYHLASLQVQDEIIKKEEITEDEGDIIQ